jgi:hypothetical protein
VYLPHIMIKIVNENHEKHQVNDAQWDCRNARKTTKNKFRLGMPQCCPPYIHIFSYKFLLRDRDLRIFQTEADWTLSTICFVLRSTLIVIWSKMDMLPNSIPNGQQSISIQWALGLICFVPVFSLIFFFWNNFQNTSK